MYSSLHFYKNNFSHLRVLKKRIFAYLDNFLLLSKSKDDLKRQTKISIKLFQYLGFLTNIEKSFLDPSDKILCLRVKFNLIKKLNEF